jgi:hypothetical protein
MLGDGLDAVSSSGASVSHPTPRRVAWLSALAALIGTLFTIGLLSIATSASADATGTLTVKVTSVAGAPLGGLKLEAIPVQDGHEIVGDDLPDGSYPTAIAVKGKTGTYEFTGLGDFDHTIYFATPTSTTFAQLLGGVSNIDRAQVVPAGQTTLDVSLATNAVITGTVKSPSGTVLDKATVESFKYNGTGWDEYSTAKTNSKGVYKLTDIDPGNYTLEFFSPGNTYAPVFLGGGGTAATGTPFTMDVGKTVKENWTFPAFTGEITGKSDFEYSGHTYPMAKLTAIAFPWTGSSAPDYNHPVASQPASSSGAWTIKHLAPGSYAVELVPYYYNESTVWLGYENTFTDYHFANYTIVEAGQVYNTGTVDVPFEGNNGSAAVIDVQDHSGAPISGAYVLLQRADNPDEYLPGYTGTNGKVTLGAFGNSYVLQAGTYTITVIPPDSSTDGPATTTCVLGFGLSGCLVTTALKRRHPWLCRWADDRGHRHDGWDNLQRFGNLEPQSRHPELSVVAQRPSDLWRDQRGIHL